MKMLCKYEKKESSFKRKDERINMLSCYLNKYKRKETPSKEKDFKLVYIAGMGPKSNMSFITSACIWVNSTAKTVEYNSRGCRVNIES